MILCFCLGETSPADVSILDAPVDLETNPYQEVDVRRDEAGFHMNDPSETSESISSKVTKIKRLGSSVISCLVCSLTGSKLHRCVFQITWKSLMQKE